jgi:hypothetical protein
MVAVRLKKREAAAGWEINGGVEKGEGNWQQLIKGRIWCVLPHREIFPLIKCRKAHFGEGFTPLGEEYR